MSVSVEAEELSIVARRRELRKRKILENVELRKQKIFGINSPSTADSAGSTSPTVTNANCFPVQDDQPLCNKTPFKGKKDALINAEAVPASNCTSGNTNFNSSLNDSYDFTSNFGEYMRNIPDPLGDSDDDSQKHHRTLNRKKVNNFLPHDSEDSNLSFENGLTSNISPDRDGLETRYMNTDSTSRNSSNLLLSPNERKSMEEYSPSLILIILNHPAAPCLLAVIVSVILLFDLGNLVSNSLVVPFIVWEIQQIIASYGTFETTESSYSLIEAAFLLCGIKKSVITKYIWIITLTKDVMEDFGLYMVTIIIWSSIFGYPPEVLNT